MKPRDNPFSSHRLEALPFHFPDGLDWESFLGRCEAAKWRGAIVGPQGSGKTTLFDQLAPRLRDYGFFPRLFRIHSDSPLAEKQAVIKQARELRNPEFLLLDGAEQFTTREWLLLNSAANNAAGFLITVHRTSRLPMLLETRTTPALLSDLAAELTGERLHQADASALFKRHLGNLRECLRALYDQYAVA